MSSQKNEEAACLIAGAGARLLFLPPYSPDLNTIEIGIRHTRRTAAASPSQDRRCPLGSHRTHPEHVHF
ncbi:transposase [Bradyrhizobium sp. WSM2793]|uniref:transposase n=1 Tax=Bradyrhizobium sp. WSM2793 TaxID=1038866 RepID=UPI0012F839FB